MYIYLASPYTDATAAVMHERYKQTAAFTAFQLNRGELLLSPIVHCHPLAVRFGLPSDIAFWRRWCLNLLAGARDLWVLRLDGWEQSRGVREEIEFWQQHYTNPIKYFDPI